MCFRGVVGRAFGLARCRIAELGSETVTDDEGLARQFGVTREHANSDTNHGIFPGIGNGGLGDAAPPS